MQVRVWEIDTDIDFTIQPQFGALDILFARVLKKNIVDTNLSRNENESEEKREDLGFFLSRHILAHLASYFHKYLSSIYI